MSVAQPPVVLAAAGFGQVIFPVAPLVQLAALHLYFLAKHLVNRGDQAIEDSAAVRERVVRARCIQLERFATEKKIYANAQMPPKLIRKHCDISAEGEKLLENAITRMGLSARAHDRILKVARTIADLHGAADIEPSHLGEAVQYRSLDRTYWA